MTAILLPVGSDLYALPINVVRQVVAAPQATRLVTAPSAVLGLFNLRGEIVPLVDTAALLGVGQGGPATFAVVVNSPLGPAGLAATGVPVGAVLGERVGGSDVPDTDGSFLIGGRVAVLLRPTALLDRLGDSGRLLE